MVQPVLKGRRVRQALRALPAQLALLARKELQAQPALKALSVRLVQRALKV
jgi:hypothetical protein